MGEREWTNIERVIVSLVSMLKSPMILMALAGLGLVFGMPYLLENSLFSQFLPPILPLSFSSPPISLPPPYFYFPPHHTYPDPERGPPHTR